MPLAGWNVYGDSTEKVISGSDRPHILAISYIYELPFGKGKHVAAAICIPVVNGILGNWIVSGVQRYQSGTPIGIGCGQNLFGAGNARCSLVPGQPLLNPNWNPKDPTSSYINKNAFFQPANMVYGNLSSTIAQLRQPTQLNEDLAIGKTFHARQRKEDPGIPRLGLQSCQPASAGRPDHGADQRDLRPVQQSADEPAAEHRVQPAVHLLRWRMTHRTHPTVRSACAVRCGERAGLLSRRPIPPADGAP